MLQYSNKVSVDVLKGRNSKTVVDFSALSSLLLTRRAIQFNEDSEPQKCLREGLTTTFPEKFT